MKVRNYKNQKNQSIIENGDEISLQSYESLVVTYNKQSNTITVGEDYNYSKTTSKYVKLFFNEFTPFYIESVKDIDRLCKEYDNFIKI